MKNELHTSNELVKASGLFAENINRCLSILIKNVSNRVTNANKTNISVSTTNTNEKETNTKAKEKNNNVNRTNTNAN